MRVIGITGGVGAGKSSVLGILQQECNCYIMKADDIANELKLKGNGCYGPIVDLLGESVLDSDGEINKRMMSIAIFTDNAKKKAVEDIIFPSVKKYIVAKIEELKNENKVDYIFIEAALLIEDGYEAICDEIWYVYASIPVRTQRLQESRNYTLDRIESILDSQLSDRQFREKCSEVIDNDGTQDNTINSIRSILERKG